MKKPLYFTSKINTPETHLAHGRKAHEPYGLIKGDQSGAKPGALSIPIESSQSMFIVQSKRLQHPVNVEKGTIGRLRSMSVSHLFIS
jgi:hypothetical protein